MSKPRKYKLTPRLPFSSVKSDPERYFKCKPNMSSYLKALREAGKKIFLLTNSHFNYVDAGMKHVMRDYIEQLGVLLL